MCVLKLLSAEWLTTVIRIDINNTHHIFIVWRCRCYSYLIIGESVCLDTTRRRSLCTQQSYSLFIIIIFFFHVIFVSLSTLYRGVCNMLPVWKRPGENWLIRTAAVVLGPGDVYWARAEEIRFMFFATLIDDVRKIHYITRIACSRILLARNSMFDRFGLLSFCFRSSDYLL